MSITTKKNNGAILNMENCTTSMIGERYPVVTYVSPETFHKIEAMRGDVSRSRFVGKLIKHGVEQL